MFGHDLDFFSLLSLGGCILGGHSSPMTLSAGASRVLCPGKYSPPKSNMGYAGILLYYTQSHILSIEGGLYLVKA